MPPAPASPPARSDVPLALWPCAQPDATQPTTLLPGAARALLPAQLARRIVTEYTPPGALLVGPACPSLLHQAARLGRRAVALCPDPATARQASTALDVTVPAERRPLAQVRGGSLTDPETLADLAGHAHALVTVNFDGHADPATLDPASLAACAALLAPVQAGQLKPTLTGWQRRTLRARLARGEHAQHPVHADVLVFATPEAADA